MYVETVGEYIHTQISSWGHEVTAEAIAHGNTNMPDAFDYECSQYECSQVSKPPGSSLECEFYWAYLGYN